jgi:hypothetical protein
MNVCVMLTIPLHSQMVNITSQESHSRIFNAKGQQEFLPIRLLLSGYVKQNDGEQVTKSNGIGSCLNAAI